MSKTDKDRPYWVRCNDSTERRRIRHYHHDWRRKEELECDLIDPAPRAARASSYVSRRCHYEPAVWTLRDMFGKTVPKWYVDHVYHNPLRRDARDVLREAAKEWNATGDTDLEPVNRQGRGSAQWYF